MQVAQRATSKTGINSSGYYVADRIDTSFSTTSGVLTMSQDSDAPDGFGNALKLDCTTADTSIAADEIFLLMYQFEGQDVQRIQKGKSTAKEVTVSFYAKANSAKTYVVELKDFDNTRTCSKTFTVGTSYARHEITFPADTTGVLDDDNERSLAISFFLHAGSTYTGGTLQTAWGSEVAANRAAGIGSFFDSTDNTFFITGLQMELGSMATEFEHKSFGDELAACQRYYRRMERTDSTDSANIVGRGTATIRIGLCVTISTTQAQCIIDFPVTMRLTPTLEVSDVADIDYAVTSVTPHLTALTRDSGQSVNNVMLKATPNGGGLTAGHAARLQFNANDKHIAFDAEL